MIIESNNATAPAAEKKKKSVFLENQIKHMETRGVEVSISSHAVFFLFVFLHSASAF